MRENQPIFANDVHYFAGPAGKPAGRLIERPRAHLLAIARVSREAWMIL